jgi:U4/U6 small nuclear ribonucleoprotein PRP31
MASEMDWASELQEDLNEDFNEEFDVEMKPEPEIKEEPVEELLPVPEGGTRPAEELNAEDVEGTDMTSVEDPSNVAKLWGSRHFQEVLQVGFRLIHEELLLGKITVDADQGMPTI